MTQRNTRRWPKKYPAQKPQKPHKPAKSTPAKDRPPQQWGWRRLLRKCAKSLPHQLRKCPPEVAEALEIRASLVELLAEMDRHLRDRGVSTAPRVEVNESDGGMTADSRGAPQVQQLLDFESTAVNPNGDEHTALAHLRCGLEALSGADDMPRPVIEDCQDSLDGIDGQLQRLRDLDEAER
jgi:hypothetical protein